MKKPTKSYPIRKPVNPSTIVDSEEIMVTKIVVDKINLETYYVTDISTDGNNFLNLKLIDGSEISINERFIVTKQRNILVVKMIVDATAWSNSELKPKGNEKLFIETLSEVPFNHVYRIIDDYKSSKFISREEFIK